MTLAFHTTLLYTLWLNKPFLTFYDFDVINDNEEPIIFGPGIDFLISQVIRGFITLITDTALVTCFFLLIESLITLVFILVNVAIYTLLERKILASIQRRQGPNVTGVWGLLQPVADGLKLGMKEFITPIKSNPSAFLYSPIWAFSLSFLYWAVLPFSPGSFTLNLELGVLVTLCISSFNVYGVIIAGWASNSRYALLGALRSASQMISYEISFGLSVLPIVMWSGSMNFIEIVHMQVNVYNMWYAVPFLPLFIIFCITILAETNRTPFDLPEAEAELVSGFNVEYSSTPFALFFLAEYSSILAMSVFTVLLYLGGWGSAMCSLAFITKILLVAFWFVLVRAAVPRYRYDQLMSICWQSFLPIAFGFYHFSVAILLLSDLYLLNPEASLYVEVIDYELVNDFVISVLDELFGFIDFVLYLISQIDNFFYPPLSSEEDENYRFIITQFVVIAG